MKKQSLWNKNEQDQTIDKEVITKKNIDELKKLILFKSLIPYLMGVRWWCCVSMYLQTSTLLEKYLESIKKVKN